MHYHCKLFKFIYGVLFPYHPYLPPLEELLLKVGVCSSRYFSIYLHIWMYMATNVTIRKMKLLNTKQNKPDGYFSKLSNHYNLKTEDCLDFTVKSFTSIFKWPGKKKKRSGEQCLKLGWWTRSINEQISWNKLNANYLFFFFILEDVKPVIFH